MTLTATFGQLSDALMYSAIAVYVLAMLGYATEVALASRGPVSSQRPVTEAANASAPAAVIVIAPPAGPSVRRTGRVAVALTVLAFALHAAAVTARGFAAGRVPWGNMYEFATAAALAATGAYLVLLRRQPARHLGLWVVTVVTLVLGLAATVLYTPAGDLVPALNSYWLVIHVAAAIIAGGAFTVGAAATALYLLRIRADRRGSGRYAAQLPPAATLDRLAHSAHLLAFPIWTFAVIAGAIWAEASWGRYWGWDPKETWAFVTWLLYAAHLHASATPGRGRRSAPWFALAGYLAFLFNFFGVNIWITGLHSYAGL